MSRSDLDPRSRVEPCSRCHTAAGFLASSGSTRRDVPEHAPAFGLSCPTCHDVHEHGAEQPTEAATAALLRDTTVPEWISTPETSVALSGRAGRLCVGCHAPDPATLDASASAAALWSGRGGIDPESGEPLSGPAAHAAIAGGCSGCHGTGPEPEPRRGGSHAFQVDRGSCNPCHQDKTLDPELAERAKRLLDVAAVPRHDAASTATEDASTARGRAIYDARLVAEDPAAGWHNATYARALLDAAEAVLLPGDAP